MLQKKLTEKMLQNKCLARYELICFCRVKYTHNACRQTRREIEWKMGTKLYFKENYKPKSAVGGFSGIRNSFSSHFTCSRCYEPFNCTPLISCVLNHKARKIQCLVNKNFIMKPYHYCSYCALPQTHSLLCFYTINTSERMKRFKIYYTRISFVIIQRWIKRRNKINFDYQRGLLLYVYQ